MNAQALYYARAASTHADSARGHAKDLSTRKLAEAVKELALAIEALARA